MPAAAGSSRHSGPSGCGCAIGAAAAAVDADFLVGRVADQAVGHTGRPVLVAGRRLADRCRTGAGRRRGTWRTQLRQSQHPVDRPCRAMTRPQCGQAGGRSGGAGVAASASISRSTDGTGACAPAPVSRLGPILQRPGQLAACLAWEAATASTRRGDRSRPTRGRIDDGDDPGRWPAAGHGLAGRAPGSSGRVRARSRDGDRPVSARSRRRARGRSRRPRSTSPRRGAASGRQGLPHSAQTGGEMLVAPGLVQRDQQIPDRPRRRRTPVQQVGILPQRRRQAAALGRPPATCGDVWRTAFASEPRGPLTVDHRLDGPGGARILPVTSAGAVTDGGLIAGGRTIPVVR